MSHHLCLSRWIVAAVLTPVLWLGCSTAPREASFLRRGKSYLEKKDYARAVLEFRNAERLKPRDAEPYYQEGIALFAQENFAGAYEAFSKASALDRKHVGAQVKLAELLRANPKYLKESEEHALTALTLAPNDPDALSALALTELRLGKDADASRYVEQALAQSPKNLKASLTLVMVKLSRKDTAGAEEVLKNAVTDVPQSSEPLIALSDLYLMLHRNAEAGAVLRRALKLDPNSAPALLNLARLEYGLGQKGRAGEAYRQLALVPDTRYRPVHAMYLLHIGKLDEALAELEKLHQQYPDDRNVRSRLIGLYVRRNRAADAQKVLAGVLRSNAKDTEALLQKGGLDVMEGNMAEAQNEVNQVLQHNPDSGVAHYLLSRIHAARGNELSRQQELFETLRLNPNSLRVRLELAHAYTAAGNTASALSLLGAQAPESQRADIALTTERNWANITAQDFREARKGIDQALLISRSRDLLLQDATLKVLTREFTAAQKPLEEILRGMPDDVQALELLAETYSAMKQPGIGLQRVQSYAAKRPKSASVQYLLGQYLLRNGRAAEARSVFLSVKAADSHFLAADLALAQMDRNAGRLNEARRTLSSLLGSKDSDARTRETARILMADIESGAGNHAAEIDHWRKVVEADRTNAVALNNLAYALLAHANEPDEALKYAQQAYQVAPENPDIQDTMGWAYYRKGNYSAAMEHLQRATSTDGKSIAAAAVVRKYHFAMACFRAGDRNRGLQVLDSALKLKPNLPEAEIAASVLSQSRN